MRRNLFVACLINEAQCVCALNVYITVVERAHPFFPVDVHEWPLCFDLLRGGVLSFIKVPRAQHVLSK